MHRHSVSRSHTLTTFTIGWSIPFYSMHVVPYLKSVTFLEIISGLFHLFFFLPYVGNLHCLHTIKACYNVGYPI